MRLREAIKMLKVCSKSQHFYIIIQQSLQNGYWLLID